MDENKLKHNIRNFSEKLQKFILKKYSINNEESDDESNYKRPEWATKALIEAGHNPDDFGDIKYLIRDLKKGIKDGHNI